jgi:hypothetical protein
MDAVLHGVPAAPVQPLFPQVSEYGLMQLQPVTAAHAFMPHAIPMETYSPQSNPPSEPVEDHFAQATIGPAIPHITCTYAPPAQLVQPTAGAVSSRTTGSESGSAALPPHALASTVMQVGTVATHFSNVSVAALGAPASASAGEAALPPTEVNVAQHTRALEAAEVGVVAPAQKVGRFNVKKRHDTAGTSENGSVQTGGGMTMFHDPASYFHRFQFSFVLSVSMVSTVLHAS